MNNITCIPYTSESTHKSYGRLLVLPTIREEHIAPNGLIIPEDAGKICEEGEVFYTCAESNFKRGDKILYRQVDRTNPDEYTSVVINGIEYDAISESEVWSVNEKPHNRIFVEPISNIMVGEDSIDIPDFVKGMPQRGIVISVGFNSLYQEGDVIEYRKPEQGIFPTVNLDGRTMDVLFESDVYTVNDYSASHRIIVKIDLGEQSLKRNTASSGIALSPLFQFMLRNLQYGEVVSMGEKAQERYPYLSAGDTAILHHLVESQPYRLLKTVKGNFGNDLYEYRIINISNDRLSREIFGKIISRRVFGRLESHIVPFDDAVFLKWDFETYEQPIQSESLFVDMDYSMTNCHDIDDYRTTIARKKEQAVNMYKVRGSSIVSQLKSLNPEFESEKITYLEDQMERIQREVATRSVYINSNHLLICKVLFPDVPNKLILVPYKELYPINLLGKKYLIAHKDLIVANYMKTEIKPFGNKVIVLPIEDEKQSVIEILDSSKEKPVRGTVKGVGSKIDEPIEVGDIVHYKKTLGTEILIDGVPHLYLIQNDLVGKETLVAEESAAI